MFRFKHISAKIILLVAAVLTVSVTVMIVYQTRSMTASHLEQEVSRARSLTAFCEEIRVYMGDLNRSNLFDSDRLVRQAEEDKQAGKSYRETDLYKTVPVVGAWLTARQKAEELGYSFRVPKNQPRNPLNAPRPGVEQVIVDYLEGKGTIEDIENTGVTIIHPDDPSRIRETGEIGVIHTGTERPNPTEGGQNSPIDAVRFFRAVTLSEDCMACHGFPKGAPDILGFAKEGWTEGSVHGAFEIISPLDGLRSDIRGMIANMILLALLILGVGGGVFFLLLNASVTKPIGSIRNFTRKFGQGDVSETLDIHGDDEIGAMAEDLNHSVASLRDILRELSDMTGILYASSQEMTTVSHQMAASADNMSSRAASVASATDQISANVGTVASAAEESSTVITNISAASEEMSATIRTMAESARRAADKVADNAKLGEDMSRAITNIASSIEEMTASLGEVSKNTTKASDVSADANRRADEINEKMSMLISASKEIGKVVSVIKGIADQTNLLALNAAIEAAGAGDAGKGFAVVAGEVKALAKQSSDATGEIAGQIEEIQKSTDIVVESISTINTIISDIADINRTIAAAVQEQTATTGEISRTVESNAGMAKSVADNSKDVADIVADIASSTNEASEAAQEVAKNVDEAAGGVQEIARSSGETARGVEDIARNIRAINEASDDTAGGAAKTNSSAEKLENIAKDISRIVNTFKIN